MNDAVLLIRTIMLNLKLHGSEVVQIERKIMRYRQKVLDNAKKYDGREQEFTFYGGFSSGYDAGRLAAYEEIADIFGIQIDV